MKLVVGLGNPGKEYERTPHNVGFGVIDILSRRCNCMLRRSLRFKAHMVRTMCNGENVRLVKPRVFMNESGCVVAAITRKLEINLADLVIILDDVNLPLGRLRIRPGGSAGGHKGLMSVIDSLGDDRFARVRLGTGRRGRLDLTADVLTPFPEELQETAENMLVTAADAVECLVACGLEIAMNKFNAGEDTQSGGTRN